jgi:branched-chain amino acid transport system permease protein
VIERLGFVRNWEPRTRQIASAGVIAVLVLGLWALTARIWPESAPFGVIILGIIFGTATGLLAIGLVLIYRANTIINFSYAAMGAVGGVLMVNLYLEQKWPYYLTLAIGVATGLLLGGLIEFTVVRRFANASRLILTVATIGLAQLLGGVSALIPTIWDSPGLIGGFKTPVSFSFEISPIRITGDHLLIIFCVVPILLALAWFLLRTDVGIAVRAAADNAERALLYGIPIRRLQTIVWVVSGGLASLTFILKAPFAGAVSTAFGSIAFLLLPALAAAVIARMESLPTAFLAGIGLEIVAQLVFWNTRKASAVDVSFLVIILLGLLAQRKRISRATEGAGTWSMTGVIKEIPRELKKLPEIRYAKWGLGAVAAFLVVWVPLQTNASDVNLMTVALIWGIVGVSLVILTGWGGNISLGHFAIVGCGAIAFGNVATRWNIDLFLMLLIAGAAGAFVALLIGLPALRIQGLFLAATTLAFAVALDTFFLNPVNFPDYIPGSITRPTLFERWDLASEWVLYYLVLAFLVIAIVLARGVRRARSGRVLISTRDNYRASSAAAVPTTASKLSGFVLSGTVAGIAGGLYILVLQGTNAGTFLPAMSIDVFSISVIGGLGSIIGTLTSIFGFRWLSRVLEGDLRNAVTGVFLLLVLMVMPGGIGQAVFAARDNILRWVANRRGIIVPSLLADKQGVTPGEEAEVIEEFAEGVEEGDKFAEVLGRTHAGARDR